MQDKWKAINQVIFTIGSFIQCVSLVLALAVISGYTVAAPSSQVGDFDTQVHHLLKNEMLTRQEIANLSAVFYDLQNTLRTRWPGVEVFPLGSFVTGLASKSSDADCMVKIPSYDVTSDRLLIMEAAYLLRQHPELYDQVKTKVNPNRRMALLKFEYKPTKINCDVNFISNLALQNSHMMGYYFQLHEKFLSLAAILKLWSKMQRLRSTDALASNTLNLLIIFYLQQINVAPPFNLLQRHLVRCPVNDWETDFSRKPFNLTINFNLYQLLGGFFNYYNEFNFDAYVVSPLLGQPILRREFENVYSLPEELNLYKNYMRKSNSKPLEFKTKLCVQDAIEQRRNTANVPPNKAIELISHIKFAAKMFELLPKGIFLRALLEKYPNKIIRKFNVLKNFTNVTVILNYVL